MARRARGFDVDAAQAHLRRVDRRLSAWMDRVGGIAADRRWRQPFDVTDALARAILYQQLSGKAAATITARLEAVIAADRLHADTLGRADDAAIRACGVSGNKLLALRDLSARAVRGEIPDARRLAAMADDEIVQALLPVRGIGRWTVEMLLLFRLGRPDVLPVDDLGIRKGAQLLDRRAGLPTAKALAERGECWRPFRSYASLYLWRIADAAAATGPAPRRSQR